ncbi:MAG: hypothetical protein HUU21_16275 [Polyangiaceae bacterium]|nr:hypothetical protein [Polyangiaceae bacterium]
MGSPTSKKVSKAKAKVKILGLGKDKGSWHSHHNTALTAKVELRRWLVSELRARNGRDPMILDCFCAAGMLWDRAYDRTPNYLGLDIRQSDDTRRTIVTDCRRYLRHADVKLEAFDLFDLDAFGSPLEPFAIICNRLRLEPGKVVGFCLTDGTGYASRMSNLPTGLLEYVGAKRHKSSLVQSNYRDQILAMAIDKGIRVAGLTELGRRRAALDAKHGAAEMRYIGLLAWKPHLNEGRSGPGGLRGAA